MAFSKSITIDGGPKFLTWTLVQVPSTNNHEKSLRHLLGWVTETKKGSQLGLPNKSDVEEIFRRYQVPFEERGFITGACLAQMASILSGILPREKVSETVKLCVGLLCSHLYGVGKGSPDQHGEIGERFASSLLCPRCSWYNPSRVSGDRSNADMYCHHCDLTFEVKTAHGKNGFFMRRSVVLFLAMYGLCREFSELVTCQGYGFIQLDAKTSLPVSAVYLGIKDVVEKILQISSQEFAQIIMEGRQGGLYITL
jgi:hypothetical protein